MRDIENKIADLVVKHFLLIKYAGVLGAIFIMLNPVGELALGIINVYIMMYWAIVVFIVLGLTMRIYNKESLGNTQETRDEVLTRTRRIIKDIPLINYLEYTRFNSASISLFTFGVIAGSIYSSNNMEVFISFITPVIIRTFLGLMIKFSKKRL